MRNDDSISHVHSSLGSAPSSSHLKLSVQKINQTFTSRTWMSKIIPTLCNSIENIQGPAELHLNETMQFHIKHHIMPHLGRFCSVHGGSCVHFPILCSQNKTTYLKIHIKKMSDHKSKSIHLYDNQMELTSTSKRHLHGIGYLLLLCHATEVRKHCCTALRLRH